MVTDTFRLLHSGDWHVTQGDRIDGQRDVLQALVRSGVEHEVDAFVVPGDLSGTTVPHEMTRRERDVLCDVIQTAANYAPFFIVRGNHDDPADILLFRRLAARHSITVLTHAERRIIGGRRDNLAHLHSLPYVTKRMLLASAGSPYGVEAQNIHAQALVEQLLLSWRDIETSPVPGATPLPRIMLAHGNVGGSATAGGEKLIGREIDLMATLLDQLQMDYIALAHIHLAQDAGLFGRFPGSPYPVDFGETDPKGWLIVDVRRGMLPEVARVPSPAKPLVTIGARWGLVDDRWVWTWDKRPANLEGHEVRVRLEVPDDAIATCDFEAAEQLVRDAGAIAVKVDHKPIVTTRLRAGAILQARTTAEKLKATFDAWGNIPEDAQLRALARLEELETGEARALGEPDGTS